MCARLDPLGKGRHQLPLRPDGELPVALADLDSGPRNGRLRREAIEHAVIRQKAIPTDATGLGAEALPGIAYRQRS
jgi:hypothetical protein